jgi:hypothetical protein
MSDDEDALSYGNLPRNTKERKRIVDVRAAEAAAKIDCTEKTIYTLIYTIGLTDSVKGEFPVSFKILKKLFVAHYPLDEIEPDKVSRITDFAIRKNPLSEYFVNIGEERTDILEIHTLKEGVEDSISWMACFQGAATHLMKLIIALKVAVHNHPIDPEKGKESWTPANKFIKLHQERGTLPLLFTKNQYHQWIFREEDADFKELWIEYYSKLNMRICYKCFPQLRNRIDEDGWTWV